MPFSAYALDRFVATKVSEFTTATLADMSGHSAEQVHWINNYILNSALSGTYKYPYRQHAFAFLRRAEVSFREYELARAQTDVFLRGGRSPSRYFLALSHWENVLTSSYLAATCWQKFAKLGPQDLFVKNDGSALQRLNLLYNITKHANDAQYPQDSTLAVWLDNDGICSVEGHLDYAEISNEILPQIAQIADQIQNPVGVRDASPVDGA